MPKTPAEMLNDPEFHALPLGSRLSVLQSVDPEFSGLDAKTQGTVIARAQQKVMGLDKYAHPEEQPSVSGFLGNVGKSAANLIGNAASTLTGAVEKPMRIADNFVTGGNKQPRPEEQQFDNIGDTVAGLTHQGFKKAGLGGDVDETPEARSDIAKAEALENSYKKKYGSWSGFKQNLYQDPAGVLADAATLTGGLAGATGKTAELAEAGNLPRVATGLRATSKVARAATEANPIVALPKKTAQVAPVAYQTAKKVVGDYVDHTADPHLTLIQSLKPMASRVNFDKSVATAMPDIKAAEGAPGAIKDVNSLLDTTAAAKRLNRAQFEQFTTPAQRMGMRVDLNPVADAMEAHIPETVKFEHTAPDGRPTGPHFDALVNANKYRTSVSVQRAESFLRDVNAELDAYYAKYPGVKRAQLRANPETAALVAKADALRDALYTALDGEGMGAGPRELNRRYGALIDIEDAALRRKNVAARQQPESLQQQMSKAQAAGHIAEGGLQALFGNPHGAANIARGVAGRSVSNFLKEQQTTDNLIRRAFKNYNVQPNSVTPPSPPNIRGLLPPPPRGPIVTPPPEDPSYFRVETGPRNTAFRTGFPANAPKQLPASSSQIGVSGTTVPDIIGRSSRGMGTPRRLLEAPSAGTPTGGVVQSRSGRSYNSGGDAPPLRTSDVSGPGAKTINAPTPIPLPKAGNPLGLDEWGKPVRPKTMNRAARRATALPPVDPLQLKDLLEGPQ